MSRPPATVSPLVRLFAVGVDSRTVVTMHADAQNPDPATFSHIPIPDTATIAASRLSSELALDRFGLSLGDVLAYMKACPLVLSARMQTPDRVDPSGAPISVGFKTDGVWVWDIQAETYVERYAMALPADFLERVRDLGAAPDVSADVQAAVVSSLRP